MKRSTVQLDVSNIPIPDAIEKVIEWHRPHHEKMIGLYRRYNGHGIPIQQRVIADPKKPNNKLVHDYRGYIIDQVVGYLFGQPISYQIDKRFYNDDQFNKFKDKLSNFNTLNMVEDLDGELGKIMSICGYASRLLYIDTDGNERIMNVFPWESVFIENNGIITNAIRYYPVFDLDQNKTIKVEWYDNKNVYFFTLDDGLIPDPTNPVQEHFFDFVPLILFANNDEEKGDFEKVESLIDAYDKINSDSVNEIESFANAYMKFKGTSIDHETIEQAKQTGAFEVPEDGDADFITKNINDTFVENNKKTLNENIHKFSSSVDMSDEKFSGSAQTGESRKWKMLALENKAGKKALKFSKGLREQFKVLCSAWKKKNIDLNYLDIFWEFKRNVPIDLLYISQYASQMKGIHSDRTLLSQIPYIDDVDYELELMQHEKEESINLDYFGNQDHTDTASNINQGSVENGKIPQETSGN
ncbi:phage portal protein [Bacillus methanolicus]|uniref:phage portal protein n=1 Tax=Bacillus methanolicus TaxID=1471 RepID=UPI0020106A01|nr:phage portal protein [Bacillus methanolicus]UQD52318.1 phage portal protein [Bacillus methanolicus]